jgi:uncharacterized protein (TIGR02147 family)
MLTIYNYKEPIAFINDYIENLKAQDDNFSLKDFSRDLGMSSSAQIADVLSGRKKVREKLMNSLIVHSKIDRAETMYFQAIVARSKVDGSEKKKMFDLLVEELSPSNNPNYSVNYIEKEHVLTDWVYTAILSLSELPEFDLTVQNIRNKLVSNLDEARVETALFDLLQRGLLQVDDQGAIKKKYLRTTSRAGLKGRDLETYYTMICDLARESFDLPSEKMQINMFSFPIASKNIPLAKEVIKKCHNQLSRISEMDEADSIYQANLSLFPITI